jgi:hypothetical protein
MTDDAADRAWVIISTSPNSTENVLRVLDRVGSAYGKPGDARHFARVITGVTRSGPPERDDAELVDRVVALGSARGGTVEDFRWALNRVSAEEARAGRGTRRANRRRLISKVERSFAKILGR